MNKHKLEENENDDNDELGYNFNIETNCIIPTKIKTTNESKPNPEKEYLRSKLVQDLHKNYETECKKLFYFKYTPKDSLNRFLLQQLTHASTNFIHNPKHVIDLDTIDKEIKSVFSLTCKLDSKLNRFRLENLVKEAIYFAKQTLKDDYFRLVNKNNLGELLRQSEHSSKIDNEQFLEIFKIKRLVYFDLLKTVIDSKIKELKNFLYKELEFLCVEFKKIQDLNISEHVKVEVQVKHENNIVLVRYKDQEFKLNIFHFNKLKTLYSMVNNDNNAHFNDSLFVLICRYQTYFKVNQQINEGYGMQAALPKHVFEHLNKNFGVTHELFASPFNCYFKNYNSAFNDIDSLFGSSGSFFDYEPTNDGSFEANPPFTEECIERMADRLEYLLTNSKHALSFVIFIPEWLEPPTPGLIKMEKSKYLIDMFNAEKNAHKYLTGSQYVTELDSYSYQAAHNTRVFILQNKAGTIKWPVNDEKVENLKKSIKSFPLTKSLEMTKKSKTS